MGKERMRTRWETERKRVDRERPNPGHITMRRLEAVLTTALCGTLPDCPSFWGKLLGKVQTVGTSIAFGWVIGGNPLSLSSPPTPVPPNSAHACGVPGK